MAFSNVNINITGDYNSREFGSGANFNGTPNIVGANGDSFEQNVNPRIQPQTSRPPNVASDNVISPIASLPLAASRGGTSNRPPFHAASEIYARQLLTIRNGYPLWSPKTNNRGYPPIYKKNGVQIGDVGILTDTGGFDYMFNICHEKGHELNLNRVPDGFEPLTIQSEPNYRENDVAEETYTQDYVFRYPDEIEYDGKIGPNLGEFDAGLSFTSAATRGALLILPEGGKGEDHQQRTPFESYIAKHARSWFEYVFYGPGGRGGDGIYDDSLYLVTGYDKARAWGVACFDNAELEREVHLEFVWSKNGSRPGLHKYWFYRHNSAKYSSGADDIYQNQSGCAFLRGFRIALRDSGRSPEISSGVTSNYISQLDADMVVPTYHKKLKPTPTYPQRAWSWLQGDPSTSIGFTEQANFDNNEANLDFLSRYTVYHPSDVINNMILYNNPQVDIAVTHDDDWASVIQEDDKEMPEDQELIRRVCNFPLEYIDTDDHIACIRVVSPFMAKTDKKRYGNALQVASVHGDEAIAKLLLDQGTDVNARGEYGNALQEASSKEHRAQDWVLTDLTSLDRFGMTLASGPKENLERHKSQPNMPSMTLLKQQQQQQQQPNGLKPESHQPQTRPRLRPNYTAVASRTSRRSEQEIQQQEAIEQILSEAALEAQRQREMFTKVPIRSYSNIPRTNSGLLSQLMNPGPGIFPDSHAYKRGYSSGDVVVGDRNSSGLTRAGIQSMMNVNGEMKSNLTAGAPSVFRAPPAAATTSEGAPSVSRLRDAAPSVYQRSSNANAVAVGSSFSKAAPLKPTKSATALPVANSVTASSYNGDLNMLADKVKGKQKEQFSGNGSSGGYRLKGQPQDEEMEDDSKDDSDQGIQMSKSAAQEKLAALAVQQSAKSAAIASASRGAPPVPSPVLRPYPDPIPPSQPRRSQSHHAGNANAHEAEATHPVAVPGPLVFPYNLPPAAPPSSPRTTRQLMLRKEISRSLRQNLLSSRKVTKQELFEPRSSSSAALGPTLQPSTALPSVVRVTKKNSDQGESTNTSVDGESRSQEQDEDEDIVSRA